jgi:hypothetical protein
VIGATGIQGLVGETGAIGLTGAQGIQGVKGDTGLTYVHPANHPPSIITQDASNRFSTDTEKTTWNAKQAALGFTAVPNTRTVNTKALSANIVLTPDDLVDTSTTHKFVAAGDITKLGNLSNTNSGDETLATIKTKLSITTLSGANTGDQDLSGYVKAAQGAALPIALSTLRGQMYLIQGGAGVVDKVYCCVKLADNTYSWVNMLGLSFGY